MTIVRHTITFILTAALLLGACASPQPGLPVSDARKLRAGMPTGVVRDILGSPHDTESQPDGSETWTYRYAESEEHGGDATLVVHVRDQRVTSWEDRPGD